jgi:hypothetical protein
MKKPLCGVILSDPWYALTIADGANCDIPGLYEWQIVGVGSYIGKYTNFPQRAKLYYRNVLNLLNAKPHRKSKPSGYRRIHHELADAVRTGKTINLIILENPPLGDIYRRERELIHKRGTLNGGRTPT